ncbi:general stress protein [Terrihabitans soli]|uniref:General stress protein n=1 Tax=Terrihabitans soli TaxID=708113 RepID=A0A6S6QKF3_9HYPH|nr:pyridoxamine 5'-phosphate oxidase family protein [Terrihabitans soli]BCJ89379.1 general stress protein [Terrihabitans soli]
MAKEAELEAKFWKHLKSDMTVMLGLVGKEDGHAQPMTAQLDDDLGDSSPIWFFTAKDNGLVKSMGRGGRAVLHYSSKDHDLFACVHGELKPDDDALTIERLWNPYVAAWFKGGKTDPNLQLLRFSPEHAEIWLNENSLFAGVKMLLGADPKKEYKDKVAKVALG